MSVVGLSSIFINKLINLFIFANDIYSWDSSSAILRSWLCDICAITFSIAKILQNIHNVYMEQRSILEYLFYAIIHLN